jgi:hypothetical protein
LDLRENFASKENFFFEFGRKFCIKRKTFFALSGRFLNQKAKTAVQIQMIFDLKS